MDGLGLQKKKREAFPFMPPNLPPGTVIFQIFFHPSIKIYNVWNKFGIEEKR
jgi:hypothetical protein